MTAANFPQWRRKPFGVKRRQNCYQPRSQGFSLWIWEGRQIQREKPWERGWTVIILSSDCRLYSLRKLRKWGLVLLHAFLAFCEDLNLKRWGELQSSVIYSTDHNYPKSFTKLVAGTATIFTLGKRSEDLTTGKRNISRPFWNMITLLQLLITLKQLATTSNGTILTFWHPARLTTTVKLRRPCLFKS